MAPTPRKALIATINELAPEDSEEEINDILLRNFRAPSKAAREIVALLASRGIADGEIVDALSTHGRRAMGAAFASIGADLPFFEQLLAALLQDRTDCPQRCAHALTCLFCALAESGDPHRAAANLALRAYLAQAEPHAPEPSRTLSLSNPAPSLASFPRLGIARCHKGDEGPARVHELSAGPRGTLIGRFRNAPHGGVHAIACPDPTVSRRHLLIRFDGSRWLAQGLGSANGSRVLHSNGDAETIEPPRSERSELSATPVPEVAIAPGDTLLLGPGTRYKVLGIDASPGALC